MANISDVQGTITIGTSWDLTNIRRLRLLLDLQSVGYYTTDVDFNLTSVLDPNIKNELSFTFNATGRWAFDANLQWLNNYFPWRSNSAEREFYDKHKELLKFPYTYDELLEEIKLLAVYMQISGNVFKYSYSESELGMGILQEVEVEVFVDSDSNKPEFSIIEIASTQYDPILYNYCKVFNDDDGEHLASHLDAICTKAYEKGYFKKEDAAKYMEYVENVIVSHPSWYNLQVYADEYTDEKFDSLPQELLTKLKEFNAYDNR